MIETLTVGAAADDAVADARPGTVWPSTTRATRPTILIPDRWIPPELDARLKAYHPRTHLGRIVRDCFSYLPAAQAAELLGRICSCVVVETSLGLVVFRCAESPFGRGRREIEDYGVVCRKVVTDAGVGAIVDAFQNVAEAEIYNYHAVGTGSTAEAVSGAGAAMVTESTTALNPDSTRATGTQSEPAANQYRSAGTNTFDAVAAIVEHGLMNQAATGGGICFDRSVFSAINVASGDSLLTTHTTSYASGG